MHRLQAKRCQQNNSNKKIKNYMGKINKVENEVNLLANGFGLVKKGFEGEEVLKERRD